MNFCAQAGSIILGLKLEISLGMLADRAYSGSLFANVYMSAVGTLPN